MTGQDRVGSHGHTLWLHLISVHEKSGNVRHLEALKDGRRWQVTRDFPQLLWNCVPLWWCQKCKLLLTNFERTSLFSLSISFPSVCISLLLWLFLCPLSEGFLWERERGRESNFGSDFVLHPPSEKKHSPLKPPSTTTALCVVTNYIPPPFLCPPYNSIFPWNQWDGLGQTYGRR